LLELMKISNSIYAFTPIKIASSWPVPACTKDRSPRSKHWAADSLEFESISLFTRPRSRLGLKHQNPSTDRSFGESTVKDLNGKNRFKNNAAETVFVEKRTL